MTAKAMSEEQMLQVVRNALLVAGQEMGRGDEWPVIKDTIHKIAQDYEQLKIERAVSEELKKVYVKVIADLVDNLHLLPVELRPRAERTIRELKELYQARYEPVDAVEVNMEEAPAHIKRMVEIVKTLEDENA